MNDLKRTRESLKLTQIKAASLLNISRRTYQKYESLLDENDQMLQFYVFRLNELFRVDEEHGILKFEYIKNTVEQVFYEYNINFCYLFGSYSKGKAGPTSDVDLVIDSDITGLSFFGLVEDLRQSLHKRIDLLKINQLENNQELLREVLKNGIKIYG